MCRRSCEVGRRAPRAPALLCPQWASCHQNCHQEARAEIPGGTSLRERKPRKRGGFVKSTGGGTRTHTILKSPNFESSLLCPATSYHVGKTGLYKGLSATSVARLSYLVWLCPVATAAALLPFLLGFGFLPPSPAGSTSATLVMVLLLARLRSKSPAAAWTLSYRSTIHNSTPEVGVCCG